MHQSLLSASRRGTHQLQECPTALSSEMAEHSEPGRSAEPGRSVRVKCLVDLLGF